MLLNVKLELTIHIYSINIYTGTPHFIIKFLRSIIKLKMSLREKVKGLMEEGQELNPEEVLLSYHSFHSSYSSATFSLTISKLIN